MARIGLSFDHPRIRVFPAVRPAELAGFTTLGTRGCFLSHKSVLEQTLSAGERSVIICEDDLDFAPDFLSRLPAVLDIMGREAWDFFYAGYTSVQIGDLVGPEANIFRLPPNHPVLCSHFYIIRGQAIADFHDYLSVILSRPAGHPDGGPMHYDGAINHFRASRPDLVTLAILPTLGSQRSSRTDVHALRWFDRTPLVRDAVQFLRKAKRQ
ncbi:glycosyltransferase family 25 protein [Oceaniovalibus sp. ACAM 378]|uniref:glycosyltransferase family 25 protein n=1 Tax=Oceaniovalibus sp. ACAM 378 TaxID=2599923 RepID=UPI002104BA08|nr:glycosyltransferase family 25 protein [Oceaniovalibus sp. ACAM 378]